MEILPITTDIIPYEIEYSINEIDQIEWATNLVISEIGTM